MDRDEILDALRDVGQRLASDGVQADLYLVGGERCRPSAARPRRSTAEQRLKAASPQMLLTLKVLAGRVGEDRDDLRFLAALLG